MSDAPEPPRKRDPAILARSPLFAALMLVACGWLLHELWPDVAYFFSARSPIDLGGPTAFHLERAVSNRYCRIAGAPMASVAGLEGRSRRERMILGLLGTGLVVDRAAEAGPVTLYEGRLLPESKKADYRPFLPVLRQRGFAAGDSVLILRDGERPGTRWSAPALALVVLVLSAVNLRALLRKLLS